MPTQHLSLLITKTTNKLQNNANVLERGKRKLARLKNFITFDLIRVCKQFLCKKVRLTVINAKNDTCAFSVQTVSHKKSGRSETMWTR